MAWKVLLVCSYKFAEESNYFTFHADSIQVNYWGALYHLVHRKLPDAITFKYNEMFWYHKVKGKTYLEWMKGQKMSHTEMERQIE